RARARVGAFGRGLVRSRPSRRRRRPDRAPPAHAGRGHVRSQGSAGPPERKKAEKQIRFLAYYDSLTGLPNRVQFREQLKKALAVARRNRWMVAVMFMDLDNFKRINDT